MGSRTDTALDEVSASSEGHRILHSSATFYSQECGLLKALLLERMIVKLAFSCIASSFGFLLSSLVSSHCGESKTLSFSLII